MYIEENDETERMRLMQSTAILEYLADKHNVMPANANQENERRWYFDTEDDFKSQEDWDTAMMQEEMKETEMNGTIDLRK